MTTDGRFGSRTIPGIMGGAMGVMTTETATAAGTAARMTRGIMVAGTAAMTTVAAMTAMVRGR